MSILPYPYAKNGIISPMGFGDFLKDEMKYQGITTRELAEKSGVGKRTIDHYLMSRPQEPSATNAYKIAKALSVSVEYLLTGASSDFSSPDAAEASKIYNSLSVKQKELVLTVLRTLEKQNLV